MALSIASAPSSVTRGGSFSLTTVDAGASQGASTLTFGGETVTITNWTATLVEGTIPSGIELQHKLDTYTFSITVSAENDESSVVDLLPPAGWSYTDLYSPVNDDTSIGNGMTGGPLVTLDQIVYESVTSPNSYPVEVLEDSTFTVDYGVGEVTTETFDAYVIEANGTIGAVATITTDDAPASAPVMPADDAIDINENTTSVGTFAASSGSLPITYTKSGADSVLFTLNADTGALSFTSAPDYEDPEDAGGNNVYNVTITATNIAGADSQSLTITVLNVVEPVQPSLPADATTVVTEGSLIVGTYTATVGSLPIVYTLSGTDASEFDIDEDTGLLTFASPPVFATPTDSDEDNVYIVNVVATNSGGTDSQQISVQVTEAQSNTSTSSGPIRSSSISVSLVNRLKNIL